ncbi:MAG: dihydrofolate reductase family protein [Pyrinomonadaceae bacterium]
MRKVVYGGACSLDGYLAREDGAVDWLMFSDEVAELMKDSWTRFDTMLMGRTTYEVAMANAPTGAGDDSGIETYVFSTTMDPGEHKGATIVSTGAADLVRSLKAKDGKDICLMGGGVLAASLFEAGVIDEVGFNIHPILLGSGIPSFHKTARQTDLELIDCKQLKNGCVYVLYNVKH